MRYITKNGVTNSPLVFIRVKTTARFDFGRLSIVAASEKATTN